MDIFKELDDKFYLKAKIRNLSKLLLEPNFFGIGSRMSFEYFFDSMFFRQWKYSMGCYSLKELREELGLYYEKINNSNEGFSATTEEDAVRYLQYSYNCVTYVQSILKGRGKEYYYTDDAREFFKIFNNQFNYIISKIGQKVVSSSDNGYYLIVPCNEKVKYCADAQNNIALLLYEYSSLLLNRDVKRKREILNLLANSVEPVIARNKKLQGAPKIINLYEKLGEALNNYNIRHNNLDKSKPNYYHEELNKFTDVQFEKVYDATFDLILDAFILDGLDKTLLVFQNNPYKTI